MINCLGQLLLYLVIANDRKCVGDDIHHFFSQVVYLPIDPETQRKRVQNRFAETPDQTWPMSEEELMKWRAFFRENEPDEAELNGTILEDAPPGYASWSAWATSRWPSLPDEYA